LFYGQASIDFYTVVLRQSHGFWVALCLENGIVGQAETQDGAIAKLKEAIESVQLYDQPKLQPTTLSIQELHGFLTIEAKELTAET
jgi:predicted RNase H-like HicB family nuclease